MLKGAITKIFNVWSNKMTIMYLQGWGFASCLFLALKPYLFWNKNTTSAAHIFSCSVMLDYVCCKWINGITTQIIILFIKRKFVDYLSPKIMTYFVIIKTNERFLLILQNTNKQTDEVRINRLWFFLCHSVLRLNVHPQLNISRLEER